jgi:hypothetical protein
MFKFRQWLYEKPRSKKRALKLLDYITKRQGAEFDKTAPLSRGTQIATCI